MSANQFAVKVDPKCFFSVERTFIHWMRAFLLLLMYGLSMRSTYAAAALILTAVGLGSYCTYLLQLRRGSLANATPVRGSVFMQRKLPFFSAIGFSLMTIHQVYL